MEDYSIALLFVSLLIFGVAVVGAVEGNEHLMQLGRQASIVTLILGVALMILSYINPCGR